MADDLLVHYNRELLNIRRAAAAFAAENPRIAGRLRLSEDAIEDPHVSRLVESFAYLTARVRQKLDDDFPVLSDTLLSILYPHYQRPIPSIAIVQLEGAEGLAQAPVIPSGTLLDSELVDGDPCRFRTAYSVTLHPIVVRSANVSGQPITAPMIPGAVSVSACIRLTLELVNPEMTFARSAPDTLRFFLRGSPPLVYPLYELLLNDTTLVAFANGPNDPAPVLMDSTAIRPVGFERDEGLFFYPPTAHAGFRLLSEFFAFPEKFLFVDLKFPDRSQLAGKERGLDVFIYLKRSLPTLERALTADAFQLGCTPMVNLFPQSAEPLALDHGASEYRIVPDSRRPRALEIYSVESVSASDSEGRRREILPFYDVRHSMGVPGPGLEDGTTRWWITSRRPGPPGNPGSELYLSVYDAEFDPAAEPDQVLSIDTICLNRNLPERLPFGGGHPTLRGVEPLPTVKRIRALTAPTATLRPQAGNLQHWRLISHLALNHLSLITEDASAIREILMLYDFKGSAETRSLIDGLVGLSVRSGAARVRPPDLAYSVFCRGLDVGITFDEAKFSGNSVFLMASILERFLGLYASVNSFVRLTASIKGRAGALRTWPARAGDRILL